jgi:hypothetical protein
MSVFACNNVHRPLVRAVRGFRFRAYDKGPSLLAAHCRPRADNQVRFRCIAMIGTNFAPGIVSGGILNSGNQGYIITGCELTDFSRESKIAAVGWKVTTNPLCWSSSNDHEHVNV